MNLSHSSVWAGPDNAAGKTGTEPRILISRTATTPGVCHPRLDILSAPLFFPPLLRLFSVLPLRHGALALRHRKKPTHREGILLSPHDVQSSREGERWSPDARTRARVHTRAPPRDAFSTDVEMPKETGGGSRETKNRKTTQQRTGGKTPKAESK